MFLILASVAGCQGATKQTYTKVKGTVTFDGKPLDKAQIYFTVSGKPPVFIDVVDGKFSGQAIVGSNTISLSAKRKTGVAPVLPKEAQQQQKAYKAKSRALGGADPNATYDSTFIDLIPPEWGAASKQVRVVEAGAENDFDFNIKK
jgi:hypothetical protein